METIPSKSKSNSTIMINYSFIIPHHNSPKLLERCLDSIPQRNDIEIIVVDDNSDADKKAYSYRGDVRIINIDVEHTKGAGRARNYGMKEARGKWILFADCDDFYIDGFLEELDKVMLLYRFCFTTLSGMYDNTSPSLKMIGLIGPG